MTKYNTQILMQNLRIGRHISTNGQLENVATYAKELGCNIFQIFLYSPISSSNKTYTDAELNNLSDTLKKCGLKMVVHGSYEINLCHSKNTPKYVNSIKKLTRDLNIVTKIGSRCLGVIIHMGKNIPENNISNNLALKNYIIGLQDVLSQTPDNTTIILETGASQGKEIGSKIDGLAEIYNGLNETEQNRILFCIDTCHIWATGYDISNSTGVKLYFKEFEKKIGISKIACIHFNDSRNILNSHVDRHADLSYGNIHVDGLKSIAQFAQKYHIPLIMETPLNAIDKNNHEISFQNELTIVKSWLK